MLFRSVAERTLLGYYNTIGLSRGLNGNSQAMKTMPFPGGKGKIWECPSASMSLTTIGTILQVAPNSPMPTVPGATGFFSYAMNIDLKRGAPNNPNPPAWPNMPKITAFRNPSATVCMFDIVFDPLTEVVNAHPEFNSVNPAGRQNSFAGRHVQGGIMNFMDGHAAYFKDSYVTNGNNGTSGVASSAEPLISDIIWNAAGRGAEFGM